MDGEGDRLADGEPGDGEGRRSHCSEKCDRLSEYEAQTLIGLFTNPSSVWINPERGGRTEHGGMRRTQARSNSISGGGKASQGGRKGESSLELARLSEGKKGGYCTAVLARRDHDGVCTVAQAGGRVGAKEADIDNLDSTHDGVKGSNTM